MCEYRCPAYSKKWRLPPAVAIAASINGTDISISRRSESGLSMAMRHGVPSARLPAAQLPPKLDHEIVDAALAKELS